MLRHLPLIASLPCLCLLSLAPSLAFADTVLLLPAKGQVPGQVLSQTLENETRLGVLELSHTLVPPEKRAQALLGITDGQVDSPEEFAQLARQAQAQWVLAPSISQSDSSYRLEIVVYYNSLSRTESVARDIDPNRVHQQVVEMMRVVLRPEGVGTAALPWENVTPSAKTGPTPSQSTAAASPPSPTLSHENDTSAFFAGVGIGLDSSLKRPENAVGTATATTGSLQVGWAATPQLHLALQGNSHLTGPRAFMLDASAKYLIALDSQSRFFVGPELALGLFFAQAGSKDTTPLARISAAAGWKASSKVTLMASLGDFTWIPASSGTLVLGGAALNGIVRF